MRKSATDRSGWVIANGRLIRDQKGAPRFDEPVPATESDIAGTRALRDKVKAYGKHYDLSEGRINAGLKTLTEAGYYVSGPRSCSKRVRWILGQLSEEQRQEVLLNLPRAPPISDLPSRR